MAFLTTSPLPTLGPEVNVLTRRASLGAANMPTAVNLGAPGARDDVRAYGQRLLDAYRDFRLQDLEPFFLGPLTPAGYEKYADLIGAVSPSAAVQARERAELERQKIAALSRSKSRTDAEMKLTGAEDDAERKLDAYLQKISGFDLTGPSPSQAWRVLQGYEDELDRERKTAFEIIGKPLQSEKPNLGEPTALELAATIGKWALVIVGVGVAAWVFLPSLRAALGSSVSGSLALAKG